MMTPDEVGTVTVKIESPKNENENSETHHRHQNSSFQMMMERHWPHREECQRKRYQ
jgi:hypothetical protein